MSWFKSFWKKLTTPTPQAPHQPEVGFTVERASNFTPRAQQVLGLAHKEADRLNHNFVGTEHVLLGLVKLGQGVSVNVLQKQGVDLGIVRAEVEKQVGTGPGPKMFGPRLYTPRVMKVLDLARREARALNHTYIGTEHILLGLLRESDGVAASLLRNLGVDIEKTRQEILKELDPDYASPGGSPSAPDPAQPKATSSQPMGDPVDTSKRYDVYCTDRSQGVTVYRKARFKGIKHLFPRSAYDTLSGYVELEQENGQTVFVSRGSIIRFSEPGT